MNRDRIDLLAGLLFVAAAASIVFIALRAANLTEYDPSSQYHVKISFANIGQLKVRSPVKSSGVVVGRVQRISFDSEMYVALVEVGINEEYQFPADSIFSIVSTNLLGDQYVSIEVGGADEFLVDGQNLVGNSAIILEELISKFLFDGGEETL